MLFEFSTFNNKALSLLLFFKLHPPKQKLTIKQNKEIAIETLSIPETTPLKGIFAILSFFCPEAIKLNQLDILNYLLFLLIEKVAHPKKPDVWLKVIKNRKYKDIEGLMETIQGGNKEGNGHLDIVSYVVLRKYYQQNEKNQKQFPLLSKWFSKMNYLEQEIKQLSETYHIENQGIKEQKVQKKKKEEKKAAPKPVQNEKKEKPKAPKKQQPQISPEQLKQFNSLKIQRLTASHEILPSETRRNVLITSALPYVNNVPHLGNLIGCVLSGDVFARYCRLRNYNAIYICGTDEYGTATEMKALQENMTPQQICDKYFKIHKEIYEWFDIDFDHFGRTTTKQQTEIAQDIFMQLHDNKMLDEGQIDQFYCNNCKTYLADRFIKGVCPHCEFDDAKGDQCDSCQKLLNPIELISPQCNICKKTPELKQSTHIFLDLPKLADRLEKWINKASVEGDWNQNSRATTAAWLKTGLKKRCITRDLKWGTPVPLEKFKEKVFYVWFDAPIGYISITANYTKDWEKWWKNPRDVKLYQFMGKDNIPFHTVIFPSSLIGSKDDWTLLHHISTTEYLNYENLKFSKTRGTGIFGDGVQDTGIPVEVWRYYLLVNRPETKDTVFQWKDFQAKNNCELLMNVGNLVQRALKFVQSKYSSKIPSLPNGIKNETDKKIIAEIYADFVEYVSVMEKVEIKEGLRLSMQISSKINKYIQDEKPWEKEQARSDEIIFISVNLIRLVSLVFEPFMPSLSAKINWMLGEQRTERDEILIEWIFKGGEQKLVELVKGGQVIREVLILFVEYDDEFIDKMAKKYAGQQN